MKDVFYAAWTAFGELCGEDITLCESQKENFVEKCCDAYKNFSNKYMHDVVTKNEKHGNQLSLDRHKTAAIISVIGANGYIKSKKMLEENEILWGQFTIPLVVGLSLVQQDFNDDLHRFKILKETSDIQVYIPTPSSCDRYYIDALARNIYYGLKLGEKYTDVMIMDLANIFFLLEECSLLKNEINIKKWLEYKKRDNDEKDSN